MHERARSIIPCAGLNSVSREIFVLDTQTLVNKELCYNL